MRSAPPAASPAAVRWRAPEQLRPPYDVVLCAVCEELEVHFHEGQHEPAAAVVGIPRNLQGPDGLLWHNRSLKLACTHMYPDSGSGEE